MAKSTIPTPRYSSHHGQWFHHLSPAASRNNHSYPTLTQSSFETLQVFPWIPVGLVSFCFKPSSCHLHETLQEQFSLATAMPKRETAPSILLCRPSARASLDSWLHSRTSTSSPNQAACSQQSPESSGKCILNCTLPQCSPFSLELWTLWCMNKSTDQQQHLSTDRRFQLNCSSESIHKISQYNWKNKLRPVTVQEEEEKWILSSHGSNQT